MNPEIYRTLASLNESLQTVSQSLEILQAAELIAPQLAELRKTVAEELRAEINQTVTLNLHTREAETAFHHQEERLKVEQQLKER